VPWRLPDTRATRLIGWLAPLVICVAVYRLGLTTWFVQDDFGSLLAAERTNTWADAMRWLTTPQAQGVLRPLPDFFYYVGLYHWFGLNAGAFRIVAFATQLVSVLLLNSIVRTLTGSRMAGFVAATVWVLNTGLVVGMSWSSAYSQVLCAFLFLLGCWLFLRHIRTGAWRWYGAQWVALVAGIGTLEIIIVYPVVLLCYCLVWERKQAWKALPMLAVTAGYAGASLLLVERSSGGPYQFHWDTSILAGLWHYWTGALGARPLGVLLGWPMANVTALSLAMTIVLGWGLIRAGSNRQRVALWGLGWFVLTLAPVLPLRDQRMDYYLTIPSIGFAVGVAAILGTMARPAAIAWLLLYAACSLPVIDNGMRFWNERSHSARRLLEGVQAARSAHPDQAILLDAVSDALFYAAIYDHGLAAVGLSHVYLSPGPGSIRERAGLQDPARFQLPTRAVSQALSARQAVVFRVSGTGELTSIQDPFIPQADGGLTSWVDAGEPFMSFALGAGWHEASGGSRWMGRRAEVHLSSPRTGQQLHIRCIFPGAGKAEPVRLTIQANGLLVGTVRIDQGSTDHTLPLPEALRDALRGRQQLELVLEADHTFHVAPDPRDLSVAFGLIEWI
jgi:hypothetical protein